MTIEAAISTLRARQHSLARDVEKLEEGQSSVMVELSKINVSIAKVQAGVEFLTERYFDDHPSRVDLEPPPSRKRPIVTPTEAKIGAFVALVQAAIEVIRHVLPHVQ